MKTAVLFVCMLGLAASRVWSVEIVENGTASFNTTAPTSSDIPNWDAGWGSSGVTGWNYVGYVQNAGGVYLGNGWVITAGHVGEGNFYLGGFTYDAVPNSAVEISDTNGQADLTLFQIATSPDLPALTIATGTPRAAFPDGTGGSEVAMLGMGGGSESWGLNTVTENDLQVQVTGYSFTTIDFQTAYGDPPTGFTNLDNEATLIAGDSGGGDFIYDSQTGKWQLAGINEAVDQDSNSYMVELSHYATQINPIVAVPEPGAAWLVGLGVVLIPALRRRASRSA
jgi:hypothetical protein